MSKCEWRSDWDKDYRCRVAVEEGSKFCIFHEPGEKNIERFKQAFYSQIREKGMDYERNAQYDFTGYVFPTGLTVQGEEAELNLPWEISWGLIMAESTIEGNADFWGAEIEGDAQFSDAEIGGNADSLGAEIGGDAGFLDAEIGGDAGFVSVKIREHAFFADIKIGGNADFQRAEIGETAVFWGAEIRADARFWHAEIGADASFFEAGIGGDADFCGAEIGGNAVFWGATIAGDAYFLGTKIGSCANFADTIFEKRADFEQCHAGDLYLGYGRPTILPIARKRCGIDLRDAVTGASFWRFAHLTLEKEGHKEEADAAHYYERMWQWKALRAGTLERPEQRAEGRRWSKWLLPVLELLGIGFILKLGGITLTEQSVEYTYRALLKLPYTFLWALDCLFLRWTTAYGSSLSRLFTTWGVIVGAFAATYHLVGIRLFDPLPHSTGLAWPLTFGRALYFSIITFTTLGYGDIKPAPGLGSALCATEAILGGIMMALTVLVIGRKFMR